MSGVSFKHVNKTYPSGYQAVKDFNLEIEEGEFIVFAGPSGCGKSTVLRMLAGFEDASSGDMEIKGVRVNDLKIQDRNIAMIFQNYALYPRMTVYENIACGLKLRYIPDDEIDQVVKHVAELVELEQVLDRKPKMLSEGQKQRLAFARAIVISPRVLLMDEPKSDVNVKLRGKMRAQIAKLQKKIGATIIYITHDPNEALTLGDRIVVMNSGVVQQIGTPDELYYAPKNLFVANFFGEPKMNILDAVCKKQGESVILDLGKNQIVISGEKAERLIEKGYDGKQVIFGIRPEDIYDEEVFVAGSPNTVIEATILMHEYLDKEVHLEFCYEGAPMTAIVNPKTNAKLGETIPLAFDPRKIHVFDKDTEITITN